VEDAPLFHEDYQQYERRQEDAQPHFLLLFEIRAAFISFEISYFRKKHYLCHFSSANRS